MKRRVKQVKHVETFCNSKSRLSVNGQLFLKSAFYDAYHMLMSLECHIVILFQRYRISYKASVIKCRIWGLQSFQVMYLYILVDASHEKKTIISKFILIYKRGEKMSFLIFILMADLTSMFINTLQ